MVTWLLFALYLACYFWTSSGHSVSWGYTYNCTIGCPNGKINVTVWSGCYHDATGYVSPAFTQNEGYLEYTPTDSSGVFIGPSTSVLFDIMSVGKRPAGLIDGKTHFYASPYSIGALANNDSVLRALIVQAPQSAVPVSWQGKTISVTPGYYRAYYDTALSAFDQVFMPKPGILYGIVMYIGCYKCAPNGVYSMGVKQSLAPTKFPTQTPTHLPTSTYVKI